MAMHPEIKTVHTNYVWLKEGYGTKDKVHRDFLGADWAKFEARAAKMEKALANNNWPKNKTGLCKKYCDVITCEHNGQFQS